MDFQPGRGPGPDARVRRFFQGLANLMSGSRYGGVLYRGEDGMQVLAPSTTGLVLHTRGAGAKPEWAEVTSADLRDSAALSVIGRSANSAGDPGDIAAANDGEALLRVGTVLGFNNYGALTTVDPALTDEVPLSDASDSNKNKNTTVERLLGFLRHTCDGRLTTETAVPVSTSDRASQGTIYFTPYQGNQIALYDGTRWKLYVFSEVSLALTATSGTNYDVFLYDNAGTLTLELTAWTDGTTRATAIALQDGVYVKSGATTRRYLGTIRASGSNVTEDSLTKRFVWNYYHRIPRPVRVVDGTDTWTYSTAAYRQKNASTNNAIAVVVGAAESLINLIICGVMTGSAAGQNGGVAVGRDSTTVPTPTNQTITHAAVPASCSSLPRSFAEEIVPLGYHAYNALEYGHGSGTQTWYGDNGNATLMQTGMSGFLWC
jgi:hypothetical protein